MEGSGHSPLETQTVRHGMVAWTLGQSILGVSPQLPMDASLRDMTTDASSVVRHLDPTGTSNDNPGHSHHTAVSRLIQTVHSHRHRDGIRGLRRLLLLHRHGMTVGQGLKLLAIVDHTILATTTCMTITYLSPTDADLKTAPFFEKVMT